MAELKPSLVFKHPNAVYWASFSPDGKLLASASLDNTVKIWDLENGKERATCKGHTDGVSCVLFAPDGKTIVSSSLDGSLRRWSVDAGQEMATIQHGNYVTTCAGSANGKWLASGGFNNEVRIFQAGSGALVAAQRRTAKSFKALPSRRTARLSRQAARTTRSSFGKPQAGNCYAPSKALRAPSKVSRFCRMAIRWYPDAGTTRSSFGIYQQAACKQRSTGMRSS